MKHDRSIRRVARSIRIRGAQSTSPQMFYVLKNRMVHRTICPFAGNYELLTETLG